MAKGPDTRVSIWDDDVIVEPNREVVTVVMKDWGESTIAVMKEELRGRELPVSGSHADLVSRLEVNDAASAVKAASDEVYEAAAEPEERIAAAIERLAEAAEVLVCFLEEKDQKQAEQTHVIPVPEGAGVDLGGESPEGASRDQVRDVARKLLTAQPDGRSRALRVLAEYGGSVSAVPGNDLERCAIALGRELAEVAP